MNAKIEQARNLLVQIALDDICSEENFSDFHRHAYCAIAKLGLQLKVKEEDLFEGKEWSNPQSKEYLIEKLKEFILRSFFVMMLPLIVGVIELRDAFKHKKSSLVHEVGP